MRRLILSLGAAVLLTVFSAEAQEEPTDAEYIVSQLVTPETYASIMDVMAPILATSIQAEALKLDKEISDPSAQWLGETMASRMAALMAERMKPDIVAVYEDVLSKEALSAYRIFLESDGGQEFVSIQQTLLRESTLIGEKHGSSIAGDASQTIIAEIQKGKWPEGVSGIIKRELEAYYDTAKKE